MSKFPRSSLIKQINDAGYCFNASFTGNKIDIFFHSDKIPDVIFYKRGYATLSKALSAMLDKIAELGISGKYLTKEMIKDE